MVVAGGKVEKDHWVVQVGGRCDLGEENVDWN
jgi:hypothetical protein